MEAVALDVAVILRLAIAGMKTCHYHYYYYCYYYYYYCYYFH